MEYQLDYEYELWLDNCLKTFFLNLDAEIDAMAQYFMQEEK